jgi:hypothetical protein
MHNNFYKVRETTKTIIMQFFQNTKKSKIKNYQKSTVNLVKHRKYLFRRTLQLYIFLIVEENLSPISPRKCSVFILIAYMPKNILLTWQTHTQDNKKTLKNL